MTTPSIRPAATSRCIREAPMPPTRSSSSARPISIRCPKSRATRIAPIRRSKRSKRSSANIPIPNMPSPPNARSRTPATRWRAKETDIGRQLQNTHNYVGAINRFKVVVTRYQRTRHVEEALLRLTEVYMALGIVEEAQTSAAVLGHNFPESRWYKDAYALMQSKGV